MISNLLKQLIFIVLIILLILICKSYIKHNLHDKKFTSKDVTVIDGDSLVLSELKVRLKGIDAPEYNQECNKTNGEIWKCGKAAKAYLVGLISEQEVSCTDEGKDIYGRQLSYCYVGNLNLNKEMLRSGHAIVYDRFDLLLSLEEAKARFNNIGIWDTEFEEPKVWKKGEVINKN